MDIQEVMSVNFILLLNQITGSNYYPFCTLQIVVEKFGHATKCPLPPCITLVPKVL